MFRRGIVEKTKHHCCRRRRSTCGSLQWSLQTQQQQIIRITASYSTLSSISVPFSSAIEQQQQQFRGFATKKDSSSKNTTTKKTEIFMCYSDNDIEDNDEVTTFEKPPTSLKALYKVLKDTHGLNAADCKSLEYYNAGTWEKIADVTKLNGTRTLLRVPDQYDDGDFSDGDATVGEYTDVDDDDGSYGDDDDEYNDEYDEFDDGRKIEMSIRFMVEQLQSKQCKHSAEHYQLKFKDGTIVSTKTFVLEEANPELQSLLLQQPGLLQHVMDCIHYSFLWKNKSGQNQINK